MKFLRQNQIYKPSLSRGFTLIELLVVITILGALATIVFSVINPLTQFQRSRDADRKSSLAQIQRMLEQYYNDFGSYPTHDTSDYTIKNASGNKIAWGASWVPYANLLPKDPLSTQRFVYSSTGQSYRLYTHLEREGKDPQACNPAGGDCQFVPGANLCGGGASCNYGVSSTNVSP